MAVKVLERAGLTSFFVQAGGDLFARGKKPDGSDWQAGIRDPRGKEGAYFAKIPLTDHAFSTAGDYERSYIVDGKRYHHIIDPRTGHPATACRSVTIWAPTALLADEIDDAVFILGPEKGAKLVESLDGVAAVIVDAKNNVHVSKRLQGKIELTGAPTDGIWQPSGRGAVGGGTTGRAGSGRSRSLTRLLEQRVAARVVADEDIADDAVLIDEHRASASAVHAVRLVRLAVLVDRDGVAHPELVGERSSPLGASSVVMPTTERPCAPRRSFSWLRRGAIILQGPHHVAQKSTSTTRPRSATVKQAPSRPA